MPSGSAERLAKRDRSIAVIGVGYVGLPLALALGRHHPDVIAYDIDGPRIAALNAGVDWNDPEGGALDRPSALAFTDSLDQIRRATAYIVTVPTPIDSGQRPDLGPLMSAARAVGGLLKRGDLVILESTVYPGVTEEVFGPLLAETAGLAQGTDFALGYSPERINPGDTVNTLETVVKIVAGQDDETLERVAAIYAPAVKAGLFRAASIQVAEAAKVVENVQRDLNIALMNELALIFDRMGLRTTDVIDAAATKWNFQRFTPGLVGGHCIGVDPYYLISRAESLGYYPEVIRAARRLNNGIAPYVARRTIDMLIHAGRTVRGCRVGVLGLTFKENVADFRNSQVPAIVAELQRHGVVTLVHDPVAEPARVADEHGIRLSDWHEIQALDALLLAVPHGFYRNLPIAELLGRVADDGVLVDVKSALDPSTLPHALAYWSL